MEFLNAPWFETVRIVGLIVVVLYLVNRLCDAPWSKEDRDAVDRIVDRIRNPRP